MMTRCCLHSFIPLAFSCDIGIGKAMGFQKICITLHCANLDIFWSYLDSSFLILYSPAYPL